MSAECPWGAHARFLSDIAGRALDRVRRSHAVASLSTAQAPTPVPALGVRRSPVRPSIFAGRIVGTGAMLLRVDRWSRGAPGGTVARQPPMWYAIIPQSRAPGQATSFGVRPLGLGRRRAFRRHGSSVHRTSSRRLRNMVVSTPHSTDSQRPLRADPTCDRTIALRESGPQHLLARCDLLDSAWLGVYPVLRTLLRAHFGDGIRPEPATGLPALVIRPRAGDRAEWKKGRGPLMGTPPGLSQGDERNIDRTSQDRGGAV